MRPNELERFLTKRGVKVRSVSAEGLGYRVNTPHDARAREIMAHVLDETPITFENTTVLRRVRTWVSKFLRASSSKTKA